MRNAPTLTEDRLWKNLRKVEGFHFRGQAPFGPYAVDFVCHRERLIVEVDGGIHGLEAVMERDAKRDAWLTARGYRVLRVSDQAVAHDVASIVTLILAEISDAPPPPAPSPHGGGEIGS